MTWNARSLVSKQAAFLKVLEDNEVDVAAVQEAHILPTQFRLGGYETVLGFHPMAQGSAIFVKKTIKYTNLHLQLPPELGLEVAGIQVQTGAGPLAIVSVYALVGDHRVPDNAWEELARACPRRTVYMGDFNGHHHMWTRQGQRDDRRGRKIWRWVENNNLVVMNDGSPTRMGNVNQQDTAVDLVVVPADLRVGASWEVMDDSLHSDHWPAMTRITLPGDGVAVRAYHSTRKWNTAKGAEWGKYQEAVRAGVARLQGRVDYVALVGVIHEAADIAFKKRPTEPRRDPKSSTKCWWTEECDEAVARRRAAQALARRRRTQEAYRAWMDAAEAATNTIRAAKAAKWTEYIEGLQPPGDISEMWRMARRFAGRQPPNTTGGAWLDEFLEKLTPDTAAEAPPDIPEAGAPDPRGLGRDFSMAELEEALAKLKDKAPGMDHITGPMLRMLPEEGKKALLEVINGIWDSAEYPADWNRSLLMPILKPGKPADAAGSYRPIALASVVFKLFERMLKPRLEWWMEAEGLLHPAQSGFRKGRNTADAIGTLTAEAMAAMARGRVVVAMFADVAGAYNSIRPALLLRRLQEAGAHPRILASVRATMYGQQLYATFDGRVVGPRTTDVGLAQGLVNSPLYYIFDKTELCNNLPPGVRVVKFADDVAVYAAGASVEEALRILSPGVQEVARRLRADGADLAAGKSAWMAFSRQRRRTAAPLVLEVEGEVIPRVDSMKYLGVILTPNLSFKKHVEHITRKCKTRLDFLRSVARARWGSHPALVLRAYKTTVRPVLEYGAGLVDPGTKREWNRLQRTCNAGLRVSMGAMPSSPTLSVLVEAAEWPLKRRFEYLTDRLLLRWRYLEVHPALKALQQCVRAGAPLRRLRARTPLLVGRLLALPPLAPRDVARRPRTWPCYSLGQREWAEELRITTFFPPAPVAAGPGEQKEEELREVYRALRAGAWREFHPLATDGSRAKDAEGQVSVGAAVYDAVSLEVQLFSLPPPGVGLPGGGHGHYGGDPLGGDAGNHESVDPYGQYVGAQGTAGPLAGRQHTHGPGGSARGGGARGQGRHGAVDGMGTSASWG